MRANPHGHINIDLPEDLIELTKPRGKAGRGTEHWLPVGEAIAKLIELYHRIMQMAPWAFQEVPYSEWESKSLPPVPDVLKLSRIQM